MTATRRAIAVRIRADVVEALDETAADLVVSRNWLIERAVEEYLERLDPNASPIRPGRTR